MKGDKGQALIETLLLGLVLMAPLLWALGVLADVHRNALATSAAAREAGFEASRANGPEPARREAERAVARAFADHGLSPREARLRLSTQGLERGATIEVIVSTKVPVLQAPFLGRVSGPSIRVDAKHVARVPPYASRR